MYLEKKELSREERDNIISTKLKTIETINQELIERIANKTISKNTAIMKRTKAYEALMALEDKRIRYFAKRYYYIIRKMHYPITYDNKNVMEEERKIVLVNCYYKVLNSTFKKYKKGEAFSFWAVFMERFKWEIIDMIQQRWEEESTKTYEGFRNIKYEIKKFLSGIAQQKIENEDELKKIKKRIDNNIKYFNYDKICSFLKEDLAGTEEDERYLSKILEKQIVELDKPNLDSEGNGLEDKISTDMLESSQSSKDRLEHLIDKVKDLIQLLGLKASNANSDKIKPLLNSSENRFIKAVIGIIILRYKDGYGLNAESELMLNDELREVDLDLDEFSQYYYQLPDRSISNIDIIAGYLKGKSETMRKYPKKISDKLKNLNYILKNNMLMGA